MTNRKILDFIKNYGFITLIGVLILWQGFGVMKRIMTPQVELATCVLDRLSPGDHVTVFGEPYTITTSLHYPALGEAEVRAKRD